MQLLTRQQFAAKYYPFVKQAVKGTSIFPETVLAFAVTESSGKASDGKYYPGLSELSAKYNNYFGVTATNAYHGKTVDYSNGYKYRVYSNFEDSVKDYIKLIQSPRYKDALNQPTYQDQILKIGTSGYNSASDYSDIVTNVANQIETYIPAIIAKLSDNKKLFYLVGTIFTLLIINSDTNGKK